MHVLILCSKTHALDRQMSSGFKQLGYKTTVVDPVDFVPKNFYKIQSQIYRLTRGIKLRWREYYYNKINANFFNFFNQEKPDIVLIYNHAWLIPETLKYIRTKSQVIHYLVDSPFMPHQDMSYLLSLFESDFVYVMDSKWIEQLRLLGLENIELLFVGTDTNLFKKLQNISIQDRDKYNSEIVFFGNAPTTVSGFKRSRFLNEFAAFDLKIYGNYAWEKWFDEFPNLKNCHVNTGGGLTFEELNIAYNCCKIAPVDTNTGITNGIHPKIFDIIGAEILPVAEYKTDLYQVFFETGMPIVESHNQIMDITREFLENEQKRLQTVKSIKDLILEKYTSLHFAKKILST